MKRYLLFDSGCSLCTEVARRVEEAAGGWLEARSLRDPEMRALLDKAKPGWKWEPTLVEVDGDAVRVYQGVGMRVRMVRGLGVRKALAVTKEVQKVSGLMVEVDWERRWLLKAMGGLVGAFVLLGINPKWVPLKVKTRRSWHPLENVIVKETQELVGSEKELHLQQVLQAPDVTNVLQEFEGTFNHEDAVVLQHTLDIHTLKGGIRLLGKRAPMLPERGVHLLTLILPAQDESGHESALIYRELDIPLAQRGKLGDEWQYKSEAIMVVRKADIVQLAAASVNGGLIYPKTSSPSNEPELEHHCGGCWDIINGPWEYHWYYCTSMDWNCVLRCGLGLLPCSGTCAGCYATANPYLCWTCFGCASAVWLCIWTCCTHWQSTCAQCLAP